MRMICGPGKLKMWETTQRTVSIIPRGQSALFREAGEYRGVSVGGSCERCAGHKLTSTYNVSNYSMGLSVFEADGVAMAYAGRNNCTCRQFRYDG